MIKIYLYAKVPYEAKYQLLINKRESAGIKYFNDSEVLEYLNDMNNIYMKILKKTIQLKNAKN